VPRVIHFEIAVDEPQRAIDFYASVFGWKVDKWEGPEDYWLVTTGDKSQPGIDGAFSRRTQMFPPTTNVIDVASLDDHLAKINSNGGETIVPKSTIPGVGYVAYFKDTEGNILGIFQGDLSADKS